MTLQISITVNSNALDSIECWVARYISAKLSGGVLLTVGAWDNFMRALEKYLNGPGKLTDLNRDTLAAFMRHVHKKSGAGAATAYGEKFCALWRWLLETKVVDSLPPERNPKMTATGVVAFPKPSVNYGATQWQKRWKAPASEIPADLESAVTIRDVFNVVYAPGEFAKSTTKDVCVACDRWEEFGDKIPAKDITTEHLERFCRAVVKAGFLPATAQEYRVGLDRLIRRAQGIEVKSGGYRHRKRGEQKPDPTELDGTLLSYFCCVYRPRKLRSVAATHIENYRIQLRHFARFLGRDPVLSDLTDETVGNLMQWLSDNGRAPRTCNKARHMLAAFWRYLHRKRIVDTEPEELEDFPEPEATPTAWSEAQLSLLWEACRTQEGKVGDIAAAGFWLALHSLIWNTGERIGACLMLRWDDLDLDGGTVNFRAITRKGRKKPKHWKLHPITVQLFRDIADPPREVVFDSGLEISSLYCRYNALLKEAGLPHGRDSKFHRMRKSAASFFEAAGGDATFLLGHSSRAITLLYLDPRIVVPKQAADLLFQPGAAPEGDAA
jgi:integrase